jgi:hypothetical protein
MRLKRVMLSLWLVVLLCGWQGVPAQAQDGGSSTYVVQPGDTLFRIALRFGTTGARWRRQWSRPNRFRRRIGLPRDKPFLCAVSPRPRPRRAPAARRQIFPRASLGNCPDVFSKAVIASPPARPFYPVELAGCT